MSEEPLYRELGRLCVEYSQLEGAVRLLLIDLAPNDDVVVRVLTHQQGFSALLRSLKGVLSYRTEDQEVLVVYRQLEKAMKWCQEGRNIYTHSAWFTQDPSIPYLRTKDGLAGKSGKFKSTWQSVGTDGIQELAKKIVHTRRGLAVFMIALQARGLINTFGDVGPDRDFEYPITYEGPSHSDLRTKPWEEDLEKRDAKLLAGVEE